jgi:hypothetical protein
MPNILKEVQALIEEGKLHRRLIIRIYLLFGVSLVLAGIVIFNVLVRGANPLIASAFMAGGFVLGMVVFSRMISVQWDEEKEEVSTARMDALGYVILGLYIVFEIGLRTELRNIFPVSGTVFILATVAGTLLGRSVGTVVEIHRVYQRTRTP